MTLSASGKGTSGACIPFSNATHRPLDTTSLSYRSSTALPALNSRVNFASVMLCHLPRILSLTMSATSCFTPPPSPGSPQFHGGLSVLGFGWQFICEPPSVSWTLSPAPIKTAFVPSNRAPAVDVDVDLRSTSSLKAALVPGVRRTDETSEAGVMVNSTPPSHWYAYVPIVSSSATGARPPCCMSQYPPIMTRSNTPIHTSALFINGSIAHSE